jgi:hypothetical protein
MPSGHHQHHSSSGSGKGLERVIAVGMDLVKQAREVAKANSAPASRERQMAAEHRAALVRHEAELRKHQGRVAGLKAGMVAGGAGTAALGLAAIGSTANGIVDTVLLGGLAAGSAALGWRARRSARALEQRPPVPVLPPLPPARLRPGARGADQADRVANALMHLYDLVPNVGRLYPQAGQELWRAVSDVEPLLRGQVERLASLDRIEWEMPGSRAAQAAVEAGAEITGRLRAGADALEELIAAAVRMLAAPDIGDGVPDTLAPAITSLEAFTHGLNAVNAARLGGS